MSWPDTFPSGTRMARALVTYIDCPHRVRSEVKTAFLDAPHIETIRKMRADYLASRNQPERIEPFKPHEGYYPDDVAQVAEDANARFVARLLEARA